MSIEEPFRCAFGCRVAGWVGFSCLILVLAAVCSEALPARDFPVRILLVCAMAPACEVDPLNMHDPLPHTLTGRCLPPPCSILSLEAISNTALVNIRELQVSPAAATPSNCPIEAMRPGMSPLLLPSATPSTRVCTSAATRVSCASVVHRSPMLQRCV